MIWKLLDVVSVVAAAAAVAAVAAASLLARALDFDLMDALYVIVESEPRLSRLKSVEDIAVH